MLLTGGVRPTYSSLANTFSDILVPREDSIADTSAMGDIVFLDESIDTYGEEETYGRTIIPADRELFAGRERLSLDDGLGYASYFSSFLGIRFSLRTNLTPIALSELRKRGAAPVAVIGLKSPRRNTCRCVGQIIGADIIRSRRYAISKVLNVSRISFLSVFGSRVFQQ